MLRKATGDRGLVDASHLPRGLLVYSVPVPGKNYSLNSLSSTLMTYLLTLAFLLVL